jgi:hypothetical protein
MSGSIREIAGEKVFVCAPEGPTLEGDRWPSDFIGDMYVAEAKVIALPVARLGDGFLTLSTRIAGEVVQKFVNYGIRAVFVGDVSEAVAQSNALRDYIREANRGRHVWFVADMAELETKLAGTG